jgi:RNA polymerase sigma factor (sigma-70 family)
MREPAKRPTTDHPLLADRARLEAISRAMYAEIQKVMHAGVPASPLRPGVDQGEERTVAGGESADDVLQEAVIGLLQVSPDRLTGSWEGLGTRIAHNKAVDAVRRATKGRRTTSSGDGDEIAIVPIVNSMGPDAGSASGVSDIEDEFDFEEEYVRIQQHLILTRLARRLCDEREQQIFFEVRYGEVSYREVARQLNLSGARVGQIYREVAERLLREARLDPSFPTDLPEREER